MRRALLAASAAFALLGGTAHAAVFTSHQADPTKDFLSGFLGDHLTNQDLDFTDLTVAFDQVSSAFLVTATFAADLNGDRPGSYVIGIDTGKGAKNFASLGRPDILFDQALTVQKNGSALLGSQALTATLAHNGFTIAIPLFLLPSTGFEAQHFGFSAWSRSGQIADFVPNRGLLTAVPEPATWALLIGGFAATGGALRRRRVSSVQRLTV